MMLLNTDVAREVDAETTRQGLKPAALAIGLNIGDNGKASSLGQGRGNQCSEILDWLHSRHRPLIRYAIIRFRPSRPPRQRATPARRFVVG